MVVFIKLVVLNTCEFDSFVKFEYFFWAGFELFEYFENLCILKGEEIKSVGMF